ncbi:hypothetical protein ACEK07_45945 [Alcanivoracaceae bacterium MT1]
MNPFETLLGIVVISLCAAIYGIAGEDDYRQAKAEEAAYCLRVAKNVHRDWNENITCPDVPVQVAGARG